MAIRTTDFAKFEIDKMSVKVAGDEAYTSADCVGSLEVEFDTKTVTKKCRGVVADERTSGAGTGTMNYSGHFPYAPYVKIFDMVKDTLKTGIRSYGRNSVHKEFSIVAHALNEKDEEMYLAYPRCKIVNGPNYSVENGAEEVAETELEIRLLPDEYNTCHYEMFADELESENATFATTWMTAFTSEMAQTLTEA